MRKEYANTTESKGKVVAPKMFSSVLESWLN